MIRYIALLGSTGSIGRNTLDVIRAHPGQFRLAALAAGSNIELLVEQIKEFSPEVIAVRDKKNAEELAAVFPAKKIYWGSEGLIAAVSHEKVNTMVSAITGTTALAATLASIQAGHRICLANKETLVAAGSLINAELDRSSAQLLPIDSEQSAIFQCIGGSPKEVIQRIILTASGGPFFKMNRRDFSRLTVREALNHPTWSMGHKVTIDSATLMNKALEVIEAYYLFRLRKEQVDVIIHPQSIIHSMVEFIDRSVIAQLSLPDMRIPIRYSLSYPQRLTSANGGKTLDFSTLKQLDFFPVDEETFSSIRLARHVLEQGGNAGAIFNAANEVAVEYFLKEEITFDQIFSIVEEILYRQTPAFYPVASVADIEDTIAATKDKTEQFIQTLLRGRGRVSSSGVQAAVRTSTNTTVNTDSNININTKTNPNAKNKKLENYVE